MQNHFPLIFLPFLLTTPALGATMQTDLLSIAAECRDNKQCVFQNDEITIDVVLKNISKNDLSVPIGFIHAVGPYCTLVDNITKKEITLRVALPKRELITKFTTLPPGASIKLEKTISSSTMESFRKTMVDLTARFAIATPVKLEEQNAEIEYLGKVSLRIIGKDKLEIEKK